MMKILFLDFDGVLNSLNNMDVLYELNQRDSSVQVEDEYGPLFDEKCVHWLSWIISMTHCQLVISSSWRVDGLERMKKLWAFRNLPGEILDITPIDLSNQTIERYGNVVGRGHEIQQWIDLNKPITYCIVDDHRDMLPKHLDYFVRTDTRIGLNEETALAIVSILNK